MGKFRLGLGDLGRDRGGDGLWPLGWEATSSPGWHCPPRQVGRKPAGRVPEGGGWLSCFAVDRRVRLDQGGYSLADALLASSSPSAPTLWGACPVRPFEWGDRCAVALHCPLTNCQTWSWGSRPISPQRCHSHCFLHHLPSLWPHAPSCCPRHILNFL